jgi:hypothetical protein
MMSATGSPLSPAPIFDLLQSWAVAGMLFSRSLPRIFRTHLAKLFLADNAMSGEAYREGFGWHKMLSRPKKEATYGSWLRRGRTVREDCLKMHMKVVVTPYLV